MKKGHGEEQKVEASVGADEAHGRLDRFLASKFSEWSRTRLKRLILDGRVRVGGRTISDPEYRVKPAERVELTVPPPEPAKPGAENIPLDIVHEDSELIVINRSRTRVRSELMRSYCTTHKHPRISCIAVALLFRSGSVEGQFLANPHL